MAVLRQIARDERGTAAAEFAFLLPIMLMLFIGAVEMTNVLRLDRIGVQQVPPNMAFSTPATVLPAPPRRAPRPARATS